MNWKRILKMWAKNVDWTLFWVLKCNRYSNYI
jgi:hypothetical protein